MNNAAFIEPSKDDNAFEQALIKYSNMQNDDGVDTMIDTMGGIQTPEHFVMATMLMTSVAKHLDQARENKVKDSESAERRGRIITALADNKALYDNIRSYGQKKNKEMDEQAAKSRAEGIYGSGGLLESTYSPENLLLINRYFLADAYRLTRKRARAVSKAVKNSLAL